MTGRAMSRVFFTSARTTTNQSLIEKFGRLIERVGITFISPGDLVAIKLHMGDEGTTRYVRPIYVREAVERIKARRGKPFLTDSTTLYGGMRHNGVDYLNLAFRNGFSFATVGAPVIISDGIKSQDVVEVEVGLKHFKKVKYCSAAHHADALVVVSHFTGHLAVGFGATIKNLGMGLGSKSQKQRMHGVVRPQHKDESLCTGCGECVEVCAYGAVRVEGGISRFDLERCVGCAECIAVCPQGALRILWDESSRNLQEKLVETAHAVLLGKKGRAAFFNFLMDITPDCDCFSRSDTAIVPDIGILGATDPVAIDQASVDLVNQSSGLSNSALSSGYEPGEDKLRALYPDVDWSSQLAYGEEIGLGRRGYELVDIDRGDT